MNLKPFWAWCASQGIQTPLEIRVRSDGSRFTALSNQKEADNPDNKLLLVKCPMNACITAPTLDKLADRLVHEQSLGEESMFSEYLKTLPSSDNTNLLPDLPRGWSALRLDSVLDGGFLQQALNEEEEASDSSWAQTIVSSRANFLPDGSHALTPVLDMMNHDGMIPTSALIDENNVFCLSIETDKQQKSYDDTDEIRISYGDLTNLQTLLKYGFVERDNPHNFEFIRVFVMGHAPIVAQVHAAGSTGSCIDDASLSMLRLILANTQEEFDMINSAGGGPLLPVLSRSNEVDVYALLSSFIEESKDEAKAGSVAAVKDPLVATYLEERTKTLQAVLERIQADYPEVYG